MAEETGVRIEPIRPHALELSTLRCGAERATLRFVLFEARARTTEIADELGRADEPIETAEWFGKLPDPLYNAELTRRVLDRCRVGSNESG